MRSSVLLLLMTKYAAASCGIVLPASRSGHVLVLKAVYLNGAGPFRMLVDTGNASSLLSPAATLRLGLASMAAVEQPTPAGVRHVPVALLREVRVGGVATADVEVMLAAPRMRGVDGALGQSWLVRHDYTLDFAAGRVILDGDAPADGVHLPLRSDDGVPQTVVEVDGRRRTVALDSAAPALVLFNTAGLTPTARMETNSGAVGATLGRARLSFAGAPTRQVPAILTTATGSGLALLGLCLFRAVHVSNREGWVALAP